MQIRHPLENTEELAIFIDKPLPDIIPQRLQCLVLTGRFYKLPGCRVMQPGQVDRGHIIFDKVLRQISASLKRSRRSRRKHR